MGSQSTHKAALRAHPAGGSATLRDQLENARSAAEAGGADTLPANPHLRQASRSTVLAESLWSHAQILRFTHPGRGVTMAANARRTLTASGETPASASFSQAGNYGCSYAVSDIA